jgi:hypothetical protein
MHCAVRYIDQKLMLYRTCTGRYANMLSFTLNIYEISIRRFGVPVRQGALTVQHPITPKCPLLSYPDGGRGRTYTVCGTPQYLAPEQARGQVQCFLLLMSTSPTTGSNTRVRTNTRQAAKLEYKYQQYLKPEPIRVLASVLEP